ncbi:MAG TPA: SpoIIE family protein phosphatase, partial [Gemmatimonadales bacterium]|nr:SpoIIE family protein phosphatase [Gemmatimonadales bacterium]
QLEPGDTVVLCTDGVTESMNDAGEQFGFDRLGEELSRHAAAGVDAVAGGIVAAARGFGRMQLDDITVLVLRYRGEGARG